MAVTAVITAGTPSSAVRVESDRGECWFNEVYDSWVDQAYRYARMLTHDEDLTEEILANAFLRVWRSRHTYRADGAVLSWVLSITRNCALDALRKRKEVLALATIDDREIPETPPETPLLDEEDVARVREAVSQLTEEQQQVIFLRFYEELPHEMVAARLGRSSNAVRAVQFRALARLRKLLEGGRDS